MFTKDELEKLHNVLGLAIQLGGPDIDPAVLALQGKVQMLIAQANKSS